jgi:lipoprotein
MNKTLSFVFALLITSCSAGVEPSDVAAQAAKGYYQLLLEGKYDSYVDGFFRPDSLPQSYREQLITRVRQFVAEQNALYKGIREVSIERALADTDLHSANVFLILHYGDDTEEEILVPMTEHKGIWYMR